jgi:hypothetical protein
MASRAKRILKDSPAGAAFGGTFIIAKNIVTSEFSADLAYNIQTRASLSSVPLRELTGNFLGNVSGGNSISVPLT